MTKSSTSEYLPDLCRLPVVLAVLLLTQLLVLVYVLSMGQIQAFDWQQLATTTLYNQWICMLTLAGWCAGRSIINRQSDTGAVVSCLVWVAVVVVTTNTAAQWVTSSQGFDAWSWSWCLRDLLIYWVLTGIALRYLYVIRMWRVEQAAKHAAELDALYARIRPHFLFNSMNTIASLIHYAPDAAEEAVEDLSLLLRASMQTGENLWPWQQELNLCQAYCRIEQQRLGDRLTLQWNVDAVPETFQLPPLLLQPLIENAIYHGIEPLTAGGCVKVTAALTMTNQRKPVEVIEFSIENPVADDSQPSETSRQPTSASQRQHNGMALDNIRARLASIYRDPESLDNTAAMQAVSTADCYRVTVTLPLFAGPVAEPAAGTDTQIPATGDGS